MFPVSPPLCFSTSSSSVCCPQLFIPDEYLDYLSLFREITQTNSIQSPTPAHNADNSTRLASFVTKRKKLPLTIHSQGKLRLTHFTQLWGWVLRQEAWGWDFTSGNFKSNLFSIKIWGSETTIWWLEFLMSKISKHPTQTGLSPKGNLLPHITEKGRGRPRFR